VHSVGPGPARDYGPRGRRPTTTLPGLPPGLRPAGLTHWLKQPGRPARRGAARTRSALSPRPRALRGGTVVRLARASRQTRSISGGGISSYRVGGAPGKAVRGEAHLSGSAAWMRWRMLRAAAFNGGEAAPVADDIDGVALQCRGR
jgi:hypothetical protein